MKESGIPANVAPVPNSASSAIQIFDPLMKNMKKRTERAINIMRRRELETKAK